MEAESTPWMGDLKIERFRLDNGLRVLFVRDPSAPVFACHTWFDVGSQDERVGRTGMAHLFEHLMFKETKNLAEGEFDKQMEARGASTNAATYMDWTFYHQELKTEHLEFCLKIEADRMENMILEEHQLETEREVVKNERLMRTENDPEGAMYEALHENAFEAHSYQWPVIGRKPDLDAIDLEDCRAFYRDFYAPNNAVLVLVGDLELEPTKALVEKYYGHLKSSEIRRPTPAQEPAQTVEKRVRMARPVAAEMALIAYHVPEYTHPDLPALEVANAVLFDGASSRLERRLASDLELVTRVEGWVPGTKAPALWETFLGMRQGIPLAGAEVEVYEEFDRLGRELVSREELERARSKLEAGFFRGLREATDKAYQLGFHEIVTGRAETLTGNMERWARVTREDVRRVCARYLRPENRTVIHCVPMPTDTQDAGVRGPRRYELAGGGRLYVEASRDLPLVSYRFLGRAGAFLDPPGKEGLTALTIGMLERGTRHRDRDAFEEAVDGLGGFIRSYSGHLTTSFGGEVPARNFEAFRDLVEEAYREPAFDDAELEKLRSQVSAELAERVNDDSRLVGDFLRNHLFPEHLFGRGVRGRRASLDAIHVEDVRAHYARMQRRGAVVVAAAGDVEPEALSQHAAGFFEHLPEGTPEALPEPPPATVEGRRLLLVDKPERSQIHYALGHRGVRAGDSDWVALKLADVAYGGTFTSRLMQALRVDTGWTYGVYASNSRGRLEDLYIQVAYPSAEDGPACLAKHFELYEAFCRGEFTQEDLDAARAYLVNRIPFAFDTANKRLDKQMESDFLGVPADYWDTYQERLEAVTLEDAQAAVARHRSSQDLSLVVVCTADGYQEKLAEAGLEFADVEVVDYRSLA